MLQDPGAVKHGQALAWIEHEGDAGSNQLLGVLDHGVAAVRGDDGQLDGGVGPNENQLNLYQ